MRSPGSFDLLSGGYRHQLVLCCLGKISISHGTKWAEHMSSSFHKRRIIMISICFHVGMFEVLWLRNRAKQMQLDLGSFKFRVGVFQSLQYILKYGRQIRSNYKGLAFHAKCGGIHVLIPQKSFRCSSGERSQWWSYKGRPTNMQI